jgi:hypothetical protein
MGTPSSGRSPGPARSTSRKERSIPSWAGWPRKVSSSPSQGPPRKYYTLTLKGEEAFRTLSEEFRKLAAIVDNAERAPGPDTGDADLRVLSVTKENDNG